jgi:YidC/Oxa1 family membrane protein insertase
LDRNLLLAFALSMAVFSGWLAWQENVNGPARRAAIERSKQEASIESGEVADAPAQTTADTIYDERAVVKSPQYGSLDDSSERALEEPSSHIALWQGTVTNGTVVAELTNRGGGLTGWTLNDYFETPRQEVNVQMLSLPLESPVALTSPFEELGLGDLSEALYTVEQAGESEVRFVLRRDGIVIRKIWSRTDEGFGFRLDVEVENNTDRILAPRFGVDWPAVMNDQPDFQELNLIALADGEVTRELVQGIGGSNFFSNLFGNGDDGPVKAQGNLQWAGVDLKYFSGVVMPEQSAGGLAVFEPIEVGKSAVIRISLAPVQLVPGATEMRSYTGFIGPKHPPLLASLGNDLDQTISRGWSWIAPLTAFFGWALHTVYAFIPNYGFAIIAITVLVRVATWPIMARQMKSAERMRELMPSIKELQEKYKDDRQKQSEETFKLYRETGVNPLGGCLPMVLQLPVFIGLFYALQSSIDLRHAPFLLWISDLSAPATLFTIPQVDFPIRLLPLLMGASMFVQQKMMPQTGMDPAQAKMMLIMMPGMMLVISYSFPSGLVLYWMVSNLLGIGHQLLVRRKMQSANP